MDMKQQDGNRKSTHIATILAAFGIGTILGISLYQPMWEIAEWDGMTFRQMHGRKL